MKEETLIILAEHRSYPCISIFIPTHPLIPERYTDAHRVKEIFSKIKYELVEAHAQQSFNLTEMLIKTEDLLHSLDFNHQQNGLGIYISPTMSEIISFPFIPRERIVINYHFPLREIFYLNQLQPPYFVLNLHQNSIHLFEGRGADVTEVFNENYPMFLTEEFEYEPSVGIRMNGSIVPKQFEKEKSLTREIRTKDLFRKMDKLLPELKFDVILAGNDQLIHDFIEISKHKDLLKGTINENLHDFETVKIGTLAAHLIADNQKNADLKARRELDELFGEKMAVFGIKDCWKYAHEGDGLKLYVDYELFESGYLSKEETQFRKRLFFKSALFNRIPDMVEKVIHEVVRKGGKVVFTNYNALKDYDGIALKLRYPA